MIKMNEEDARTKQDLLFEVSSLNARLSDEIVKNEQLQNNWNELKKWLEIYLDNVKSHYYNSYPATQYSLEVTKDVLQVTLEKMQELQGDDKN